MYQGDVFAGKYDLGILTLHGCKILNGVPVRRTPCQLVYPGVYHPSLGFKGEFPALQGKGKGHIHPFRGKYR